MSAEIRRPVVGVGVVVLSGPRALLVKRANPPRAGQWSLPGGRQEWGETVEQTARRELFEETGLQAGELRFLNVIDGIMREDGDVSHHYTLIDYWTEVGEAAAATARAGGDAAGLRWATEEEVAGLVDWSETRRIFHLAFMRRDRAAD